MWTAKEKLLKEKGRQICFTSILWYSTKPASYKRKKHKGKKEADLSNFEVTETKRYKLDEER